MFIYNLINHVFRQTQVHFVSQVQVSKLDFYYYEHSELEIFKAS